MDRPSDPAVLGTDQVELSHGPSDLIEVYGVADLPLLIDWLHGPERSNRVLVLFDSISGSDRRFMLRKVESFGLVRRRLTATDRHSTRRWSRRELTPNGFALSAIVSVLTAPVLAPILAASWLIGRGHRKYLLVGCSSLGRGRPGSGSGGHPDGDGPRGPDGGDRSPRIVPGGLGSMAVELDLPQQTGVVAPAPSPLQIERRPGSTGEVGGDSLL